MTSIKLEIVRPLDFVAIIPARYASSRFPGKPLVDIAGKTMIQRVYEQVSKVIADVYVATDDDRIFDAVRAFGGKAIMTSDQHRSGTDRCNEAYRKLNQKFDIIINVQGDEPFIQPEQIMELQDCFEDKYAQIATLAKVITEKDGWDVLSDPNCPKLVLNKYDEALYFSRSVIPYQRGTEYENWTSTYPYLKHIGIYAYRADVLAEICQLEQSPLELAESLEQLRWLENGYRIKVGFTNVETIGIDTAEDLEKAIKLLS